MMIIPQIPHTDQTGWAKLARSDHRASTTQEGPLVDCFPVASRPLPVRFPVGFWFVSGSFLLGFSPISVQVQHQFSTSSALVQYKFSPVSVRFQRAFATVSLRGEKPRRRKLSLTVSSRVFSVSCPSSTRLAPAHARYACSKGGTLW